MQIRTMKQYVQKNKQRGDEQKLLLSQSWNGNNYMKANREKINIAIAILK